MNKTIFLGFSTFLVTLMSANVVHADDVVTDNTSFQVEIVDYLTLTLDQSHNIAQLSPSNRFNTGVVIASVATNNAAGYTLSFGDKDDRNGLERAGYNIAPSEDKPLYNIPSVTAATEYTNLADDTYGYFLGSTTAAEATYLPVPLTSTEIASSDEPTAPAESTTVNFGVKISATRPSGTYEDTIVFSAVATPLPLDACVPTATTISEAVCMQDMNSNVISSMVTETQYQLRDNRDDKMYWVSKLADGKVWMTQNLDLDLVHTEDDADALYTHANTDLGWGSDKATTSWNPELSTMSASDLNEWSDNVSTPYSVDTGNWYWTDTWYDSDDCDDNTCNYLTGGTSEKFSQYPTGSGEHGHVGNHYNWTAAIASNDSSNYDNEYDSSYNDISRSPQNSICPAGWRLPTISDADDVVGSTNEFKRFITLYGNNTSDDRYLTAPPLYFIRGGGVEARILSYPGYYGQYWSSTVYDAAFAYSMNFSSGSVDLEYPNVSRDVGLSVRCVAR